MKGPSLRPIVSNARLATAYPWPGETAASAVRAISVSASILGIPDAELTPKVQGAILHLMEEIDLLRRELGQSRQRIAYLEQLADQYALAPAANRRGCLGGDGLRDL